MDATTLRDNSATTLIRVEHDDPTLTTVTVTNAFMFNARERGQFWPIYSAFFSRLGVAIGGNTNLQDLYLDENDDTYLDEIGGEAFCEGMKHNSSIRNLTLMHPNFSRGIGRGILSEFVADNSNIESIRLRGGFAAALQTLHDNGGANVLTSALSRCTNLKSFTLDNFDIDGSILHDIVSAIRGLHGLETLQYVDNNFLLNNLADTNDNNSAKAGCEALASLLQDPNSKLRVLVLINNNINDEYTVVLANSLKGNIKLEHLYLSSNGLTQNPNTITEIGWEVISGVLCNTSSVNTTHLSTTR